MASNVFAALERANKKEADARAEKRRVQRAILDFKAKEISKYFPEMDELKSEEDVDKFLASLREAYDEKLVRESSREVAHQNYQDSDNGSRAYYGNPSTGE